MVEQAQQRAVDPEQLSAAKDALRYFDKMVKTTGLFGAGHMNVERAREEFKAKIAEFLERFGELALVFDGTKILYQGMVVADGEGQKDDFAFRLFQDGVTGLILSPGLDSAEIDSLLAILLANFQAGPYCHDDTVTLFRELAPKHFCFAISPDFDDDKTDLGSGAEGTAAYRQIRVLLADRKVEVGSGAGRAADPDHAKRIAQLEAFFREGRHALAAEERAKLAAEADAGDPDLAAKYVEVLLRVISETGDVDVRERALVVVRQLFLGLAEGSGVEQACRLLELLHAIGRSAEARGPVREAIGRIFTAAGNRDLVLRAMRSLGPKLPGEIPSEAHVDSVIRLLTLLGADAVEGTLDGLENLPNPRVRARFGPLLAAGGKDRISLLQERLVGSRPETAELILSALIAMGTDEAREATLAAANHPRPEIRLAVLGALGGSTSPEIALVLVERLGDADARVRRVAVQQLGAQRGEAIARKIEAFVREKDFAYLDKEEKRRIFQVLGAVGGKSTIPFFRECFETKNPLKREAVDEIRAFGAYMLGVLGDRSSRDALVKGTSGLLTSSFVKWACTQAVAMLDGKLDPAKAAAKEGP